MAELGSDIGGVFDISPTLGVVTGRQALAEAIGRRLITPRGALINAPSYGYDILNLVGAIVPIGVAEQRVLEQVVAEEEVRDAHVDVTFIAATGVVEIDIQVEDDDGPFSLTVKASELRIQMLADGYLFADEDARGVTTQGFINTALAVTVEVEELDFSGDTVLVGGDAVFVGFDLVTI